MSRTPKVKDLLNTRLASGYGGWIYCESCVDNIGYLCYITYDSFYLSYQCKCGGHGSMQLVFDEEINPSVSDQELIIVKNRLCCPNDNSPLFTILDKKLESCNYKVTCKSCNTIFMEEKSV